MIKVKMIATERGSPDGANVLTYLEGEAYTLPDSLARVFCDQIKCAVRVVDDKPDEAEAPARRGRKPKA